MTGLRDTLISESTLVCSIPRLASSRSLVHSCSHPFPPAPPLYTYLSVSYSPWLSSRLIPSPPLPSGILSIFLSPSLSSSLGNILHPSLSSYSILDLRPSLLSHPTPNLTLSSSLPHCLSVCLRSPCVLSLLQSLSSIPSRLSFFRRVVPSRFRVSFASPLYPIVSRASFTLCLLDHTISLAFSEHPTLSLSSLRLCSRSFPLSADLPGTPPTPTSVSLHPFGPLLVLPSPSRYPSRPSEEPVPSHTHVTTP